MKRPFELYLLFMLYFFLSIGAIFGSISMIIEPDGKLLGMNKAMLINSPFEDYLIPALILLAVNGLFPILTLLGLIIRPNWQYIEVFNIYPRQHWAWTYSVFCGVIVIAWIAVQQMLIPFFILQPILTLVGLMIIICTLMPRIQKYYKQQN